MAAQQILFNRIRLFHFSLNKSYSTAQQQFIDLLNKELSTIQDAGTYKNERVIVGRQGMKIKIMNYNMPLLNFCANNYLGLSSHPEVIKAGQEAIDTHGAGMSSVRFICGTQDIHRTLERKLAKFHDREDAILYAACFDANGGLFEVLTSKQYNDEDAVISDELNHASIIDGIRLCKAKRYRYRHVDLNDLEQILKETQNRRRRIIATDGVFSMDGDVAPLKEICDLADRFNALVFVDDCHATGFFGPTGRGTEEHLGVQGRIDIINSTLGKALGGTMGGYTTGPKPFIDLLRQRSRPYLFSNSLAPSIVGSSIKVLDLLTNSSGFTNSLKSNISHFRKSLTDAGFNVMGNSDHPICPVFLGDARLASTFADEMLKKGIYVIGFSYPVVPKDKARIRVQISAAHTKQQIDQCISAFKTIGKKLNVI
ncbi:unnamed protein product [Brugia pahangi]|uniref:2-amino-3-ketobutyrate coenzyme A ligase, mitochondrial n=1 Tax=Brugia pahangi TaxID=6280 RepID=A0A0N4TUK8_BRUPA|nr:unnamed protein product [Brugia pahangi]